MAIEQFTLDQFFHNAWLKWSEQVFCICKEYIVVIFLECHFTQIIINNFNYVQSYLYLPQQWSSISMHSLVRLYSFMFRFIYSIHVAGRSYQLNSKKLHYLFMGDDPLNLSLFSSINISSRFLQNNIENKSEKLIEFKWQLCVRNPIYFYYYKNLLCTWSSNGKMCIIVSIDGLVRCACCMYIQSA